MLLSGSLLTQRQPPPSEAGRHNALLFFLPFGCCIIRLQNCHKPSYLMPYYLAPNFHPVGAETTSNQTIPAQPRLGGRRPKALSTDVTSRLGVASLAAVKPSVHNTWLLQLNMLRAQGLLLLLGLLVLSEQQVDGAALDLAALVRQYEDQVGVQIRFLGPQMLAYVAYY